MRTNLETVLHHRLVLAPRQQMFLAFINMPFCELSAYLEKQVEANPFLEFDRQGASEFPVMEIPDDNAHFDRIVSQLHLAADSDRIANAGERIIENLDEGGYLRRPLRDIARELGESETNIEQALRVVHSLEPAGLGARNLRECLDLQVKRYLGDDKILQAILRDYWCELTGKKHGKIAAGLGISPDDVKSEIKKLKKLDPAPLRGLFKKGSRRIVPEGRVLREGDFFTVVLEEKMFPFLRINRLYERYMKNPFLSASERTFLEKKLVQARTFLKIVQERQAFLSDVFQSIVEYQDDYMKGGSLRPLREKDVAGEKDVSVSTISRAVHGKYLETPVGLLALKDFFSPGIGGQSLSRHYVMGRIRDIVKSEEQPLSDRDIAEKLAESNIRVSVRTVNKYRHSQGILNSYMRIARPFSEDGQPAKVRQTADRR